MKNHILILSHLFPNNKNSKSGVFILEQAKHIRRLGYDVSVISPVGVTIQKDMIFPNKGIINSWRLWIKWRFGIKKKDIIDEIRVYYLKHYYLSTNRKQQLSSFLNATFTKVLGINKSKSISLIHAHSVFPDGVAGEIIARRLNIPVVISGMGNDIRRFSQNKGIKGIVNRSLQSSGAIILKAKSLQEFLEFDKKKLSFIHNGVNLNKFSYDRKVHRNSILFIGNLEKTKGVFELVSAFNKISKNFKSIKLILIGDGNARVALNNYIMKNNLDTKVKLLGWRDQSELVKYYQQALVFCLPSYQEGTPNVIMESAACGTPIVATDIDGISDILIDEIGYLCEYGSVEDLEEKIKTALEQNWNYEKIRRYAVKNFDINNQVMKINNIYQNLLTRNLF